MNHVQLSDNKNHSVACYDVDSWTSKLIYDKLVIQYDTLYHLQYLK
jgi:hypothetical protein